MRVHTLYDDFADALFVTDSFVNYGTSIGLQVDNQEDIPLTVTLQGKLDDDIPFGGLLNSVGNAMEITVAAGSDSVIVFDGLPANMQIRVSCDASTAVTGTVTIKAIA